MSKPESIRSRAARRRMKKSTDELLDAYEHSARRATRRSLAGAVTAIASAAAGLIIELVTNDLSELPAPPFWVVLVAGAAILLVLAIVTLAWRRPRRRAVHDAEEAADEVWEEVVDEWRLHPAGGDR